jgi:hypothetical protein
MKKLIQQFLIGLILFDLTTSILRVNLSYSSGGILHFGDSTPWVIRFDNSVSSNHISDKDKSQNRIKYFELIPITPGHLNLYDVVFVRVNGRFVRRMNADSLVEIYTYLVTKFKFRLEGTRCIAPGQELFEKIDELRKPLIAKVQKMKEFIDNNSYSNNNQVVEELTRWLKDTYTKESIQDLRSLDYTKNEEEIEKTVKYINNAFKNKDSVAILIDFYFNKKDDDLSKQVSSHYKRYPLIIDDIIHIKEEER